MKHATYSINSKRIDSSGEWAANTFAVVTPEPDSGAARLRLDSSLFRRSGTGPEDFNGASRHGTLRGGIAVRTTRSGRKTYQWVSPFGGGQPRDDFWVPTILMAVEQGATHAVALVAKYGEDDRKVDLAGAVKDAKIASLEAALAKLKAE